MENNLFGVPNLDLYLVVGTLLFFIIIELIGGYWHKNNRRGTDWMMEAGSYFVLALIIKPSIVLSVAYLGAQLFVDASSYLSSVNFFILLPIYLLIDDIIQYWYHRSAHEYPFLWKLHRTHHQAEQMGFFVSYRNAALYYILMPNLWWVGLFTFLGGGKAVALGLVLKQLIIIGSHSSVSYDKVLYKYKWLNPFTYIYERIFITPAFHHAHHGKSKIDGVSNPNGNFGNMFSFWDQLFNSAIYTRQFPEDYGLENDPKENWTSQYLYPLVKSNNVNSELNKDFKKTLHILFEPAEVHLEKGTNYLYCTCGKSKNQPFCDSSHHGSKFKPQLFTVPRSKNYRLCQCKLTNGKPFCDDSHIDKRS